MPEILTYSFAVAALLFGALVVILRNPVASALSLAACMVAVAGLFLSLDAYFIAIIQVLVYAGAVMVLFLFIIMLLDLKKEKSDHWTLPTMGAFVAVLAIFTVVLVSALWSVDGAHDRAEGLNYRMAVEHADPKLPSIREELAADRLPDTKLIGVSLFTQYRFHLQMTGLLLVAATVGVVLLSRREPKS